MAAEINETSPAYLVPSVHNLGGATGKGFMPGQSANPGGRPAGIARLVRELTSDGRMLVQFMVTAAQGNVIKRSGGARGFRPSPKMQYDAVCWLADRGWGKVVQTTELRSDQPVTLIQLRWGDEGSGSIEVGVPTSVEQEGEGGHDS